MKLKFLNLSNLLIVISIPIAWFITSALISPYLHFSLQQTGFLTGLDFFKSFTAYPGGFADYLAAFISQFFFFNKFGSFLIVCIASLQGFIALKILKNLVPPKLQFSVFTLQLLFGIVVLLDYRYPYYVSIRLLFAFLFIWLFSIIHSKIPKYSASIGLILACLLFYLADGAALIVFALSTSLIYGFENKIRIRLIFIPAFLLLAALIPYLGYKFVFQVSLLNVFNITTVKPPVHLAYTQGFAIYAYYALLPVFLLIFFLYKVLLKASSMPQTINKPISGKKVVQKIKFYNTILFNISIQVLAICLVGYFLFIKYYDSFKKKIITIEYFAENEKWIDVIKSSKNIEKYDFRVNFQVNRAYAHLGFLPDRLFAYPQLLGAYGLVIDPSSIGGSSDMPTSDLYFDLGFMNESQHWAFEAETLLPNSPRILKRLVMINLVNRKYELAKEFLNVLDKNMLCHEWVDKYEKYVSDTTLAGTDKLIAEKRRFTPKKALVNVEVLEGLKLLFETNQDNRMAYDYLLTFFILDSRLPEFVNYLRYYTHYKLKSLPSSWEETLSMYILKTKSFPDYFTNETISKDCRMRLSRLNEVMKSYRNDLPAAKNTIMNEFSETYWYYMLYLSPKLTNVLKDKAPIR